MFQYHSEFLSATIHGKSLSFSELGIDSLGKLEKQPLKNLLCAPQETFEVDVHYSSNKVEYFHREEGAQNRLLWTVEFAPKMIIMRSEYQAGHSIPSFDFYFDRTKASTTLLGLFTEESMATAPKTSLDSGIAPIAEMNLPAVIHCTDHGSIRVTTENDLATLSYDSTHEEDCSGYAFISFPAANEEMKSIEYQLEVVALYPELPGIEDDSRYDGFRRNFLNAMQLNPQIRSFSNSSSGGPAPFAMYFYSAVAAQGITIAPGITTLDILKQTLEVYLKGFLVYGMAGFFGEMKKGHYMPYDFLDTYPSLVLCVADYVLPSGDYAWFETHYAAIKGWIDKIISHDLDGDGLIEYPLSGNAGSWPEVIQLRPSNWWDTIGFGHKDAYGNGLAFQAFTLMAKMARIIGKVEDALIYEEHADKIKSLYYTTFYNPETGVLAGWKSDDDALHDYYFLFVNGLAVLFGLVSDEIGNGIMDKLLDKMEAVGFTNFELGLPGNLVSIRLEDYVHKLRRWGGGEQADNSDGFQIYENGGTSGCYAFFTISALYKLGRFDDGDRIYLPMLRAFERGDFQGRGENGMTYDWRMWDGTPYGYECLLADNYTSILPAIESYKHNHSDSF
jgi:hypothetical protein